MLESRLKALEGVVQAACSLTAMCAVFVERARAQKYVGPAEVERRGSYGQVTVIVLLLAPVLKFIEVFAGEFFIISFCHVSLISVSSSLHGF
jgi:hypothetical protein